MTNSESEIVYLDDQVFNVYRFSGEKGQHDEMNERRDNLSLLAAYAKDKTFWMSCGSVGFTEKNIPVWEKQKAMKQIGLDFGEGILKMPHTSARFFIFSEWGIFLVERVLLNPLRSNGRANVAPIR